MLLDGQKALAARLRRLLALCVRLRSDGAGVQACGVAPEILRRLLRILRRLCAAAAGQQYQQRRQQRRRSLVSHRSSPLSFALSYRRTQKSANPFPRQKPPVLPLKRRENRRTVLYCRASRYIRRQSARAGTISCSCCSHRATRSRKAVMQPTPTMER